MEKKFRVRVNVVVESDGYSNDRLAIEENFLIPQMDFFNVCGVLSEFNTLCNEIKNRQIGDDVSKF